MSLANNIYSQILIRIPVIVLITLAIIASICGYYYYKGELDAKNSALLGGLLSGLILVIIQFLLNWYEYSTLSKFQSLRIKNILLHRDDRNFYQKLIEHSQNRIDVLGVTAARFMEHFADSSPDSRPESRVLLEALARGVKIRILVPHIDFLRDGTEKKKAEAATLMFIKTKEIYNNFEYLYFDHEPAHSIVVVDDESIIGPVLTDLSSRHTPAIYLNNNSPYAKKYLEYFEREWKKYNVTTT